MGKYNIAVINKLNQCLGENEIEKTVHKIFTKDEYRIKAINESHFVFGHEIKTTGKGKYEVIIITTALSDKGKNCYFELREIK